MAELEELVENLLGRTSPPDAELPPIESSGVFAGLGVLWRTHGLLSGLLRLRQAGAETFGGEILSRSIFDHAATGLWLLEQPNENIRTFVQAGNREVRLLAEADRRFEPVLEDLRGRWQSGPWVEAEFEARLPPLKARLVGPLAADPRFYTWYRVLSGRVHPSAPTINQMLEQGAAGSTVVTVPPEWYSSGRLALPFAALMFWVLCMRFQSVVPLFDDVEGLAAMGMELNAHMTGAAA